MTKFHFSKLERSIHIVEYDRDGKTYTEAFDTRESARKLRRELRTEGISSTLYRADVSFINKTRVS